MLCVANRLQVGFLNLDKILDMLYNVCQLTLKKGGFIK